MEHAVRDAPAAAPLQQPGNQCRTAQLERLVLRESNKAWHAQVSCIWYTLDLC